MTGREVYQIWAPNDVFWSKWARPVPFINLTSGGGLDCFCGNIDLNSVQSVCLDGAKTDTAIILDLPDSDSIKEGLGLAALGWRPVPLFNAADAQEGAMSLMGNKNIQSALISGARQLKNISLPNNAPPVFLLDCNRTHRYKMDVSVFDNSWDLFPQDLPSADCFLKNGINKIIVKGEKIFKDLRALLYKYQKKGIVIYFEGLFKEAKKVSVKKPFRDV